MSQYHCKNKGNETKIMYMIKFLSILLSKKSITPAKIMQRLIFFAKKGTFFKKSRLFIHIGALVQRILGVLTLHPSIHHLQPLTIPGSLGSWIGQHSITEEHRNTEQITVPTHTYFRETN